MNNILLELLTYAWIKTVSFLLCYLQHCQLFVVYNQQGIIPTVTQHVSKWNKQPYIWSFNFESLNCNTRYQLHISIGSQQMNVKNH